MSLLVPLGPDPAVRSARRWVALLTIGIAVSLVACGPRGATPMPEPPMISIPTLGPPLVSPAADGPGRHIDGRAGSVPSAALVRVTNLDRPDPPVLTRALTDGSFDVTVLVQDGDELRFEWLKDSARSAPADAHFVDLPPSFRLEASTRFGCLKLNPGFVLDFTDANTFLTLQNDCASKLTFESPRRRVALADFSVSNAFPIEIPAGASAQLDLTFTRSDPSVREDTLLFDVVEDGSSIRYAITLEAAAE